MTRLRGRAPRGQRLVAAVPHRHWKTSTFVAALRTSGLTAPLIVDGAMNGEVFRAYVEQLLAPTLQPGDIGGTGGADWGVGGHCKCQLLA
jgi:hypothetical protein